MHYSLLLTLLLPFTTASPVPQNGGKNAGSIPLAINENRLFQTLAASSNCNATTQPNACIKGEFAQCVAGAFSAGTQCAGGLKCFSLPLVNRVGTSVTCTSPEDAAARMGFGSVQALEAAFGNAVSVSMEMVHVNDHDGAAGSAQGAAQDAPNDNDSGDAAASKTGLPNATASPTATAPADVPATPTGFHTGIPLRNSTAGNDTALPAPGKGNGTALPAPGKGNGTALPEAGNANAPNGTALPVKTAHPTGAAELPAETKKPKETGAVEAQPPSCGAPLAGAGAPAQTALPTETAHPSVPAAETALPNETGNPAAPPAKATAQPTAQPMAPPAKETAVPNVTAAEPPAGTAPAAYGAGY